ncbi:hypothetical protein ACWZJV_05175 [Nocardioides sp. WG-D5]
MAGQARNIGKWQPAAPRGYFDGTVEVLHHDRALPEASVSFSGGPDRVHTDDSETETEFDPVRRVGFTAPLVVREPLVWEGDQA